MPEVALKLNDEKDSINEVAEERISCRIAEIKYSGITTSTESLKAQIAEPDRLFVNISVIGANIFEKPQTIEVYQPIISQTLYISAEQIQTKLIQLVREPFKSDLVELQICNAPSMSCGKDYTLIDRQLRLSYELADLLEVNEYLTIRYPYKY